MPQTSFNDYSKATSSTYDDDSSSQSWGPQALNCGYGVSTNALHQPETTTIRNWDLSPSIHQSNQQSWPNYGVGGFHHGSFGGYSPSTEANPQLSLIDTERHYGLSNTSRRLYTTDAVSISNNGFSPHPLVPQTAHRENLASGWLDHSEANVFQAPYEVRDRMNAFPSGEWSPHSYEMQSGYFRGFGSSGSAPNSNARVQPMAMNDSSSEPLLQQNFFDSPDFDISNSSITSCEFSMTGYLLSQANSNAPSADVNQLTEHIGGIANSSSSMIAPQLSCHYPLCNMVFGRSTRELKQHINSHMAELLQDWVDDTSTSCRWANCASTLIFKTRKAYQTHLVNTHVSPLICTERGCRHKTPFGRSYDLDRHMKTVHSPARHTQSREEWNCLYIDCPRSTKSFPRKDKWLDHLRKHSDQLLTCPLLHCKIRTAQPFRSQAQAVEHIQGSHGKYECGLGSCINGGKSQFSEFGLVEHLELEHSLKYGVCITARNSMKAFKKRMIRPQHLPPAAAEWKDCPICT